MGPIKIIERTFVHNATDDGVWACSRAFLPTPIKIEDKIVRVFCSFLDHDDVGRVGYVDVDVSDSMKVIAVSKDPVLDIGSDSSYDAHGVNPSHVLTVNGCNYLYFQGWKRKEGSHPLVRAGVALLNDTFDSASKLSTEPLLELTDEESIVRAAPFVLPFDGGYRIYYAAASESIAVDGAAKPYYGIRFVESGTHLESEGNGQVVLAPKKNDRDVYGFARPWVIKFNDLYFMWYSQRSVSAFCQIKFAVSKDAVNWVDKPCGPVVKHSTVGWDSEMVGFMTVVEVNSKLVGFYNGNGQGATGFGSVVFDLDMRQLYERYANTFI